MYDGIGSLQEDNEAITDHIDKILELPYIEREVIERAGFSVAVDAVNGAGSFALPELRRRLGVREVHKLHCTPDGRFPHNPEPLPEHLTEISDFVRTHKCDLCLVTDPNSDLLAVIDEKVQLFVSVDTQLAAFEFMHS